MCRLSLNVVRNVYNSLQSSFVSLVWPSSGRWLPKGNWWEWWDPGKGPLPGLGEVGHSPREPVGVLESWTGAQCDWTPSLSATPMPPDTPYTPFQLPNTPTPSAGPQCSLRPPYLLLALWAPTPPAIPQFPLHPCHPNAPETPIPLMPLSPYIPYQPLTPPTPLPALNAPYTLWQPPMSPTPCQPPDALHPCNPPDTPTPLPPQCPNAP